MNSTRLVRSVADGVLAAAACFALATAPGGAATSAAPAAGKIAPWLLDKLAGGGRAEFLVVLEDPAAPAESGLDAARLYARLTSAARASQQPLLEQLKLRTSKVRPFYIVNAVLVTGDLQLAADLATRPDVKRIVGNPWVRGVEPAEDAFSSNAVETIEWGVTMVRAPDVWSGFGVRGEGIVIASQDTGVDWTHPAIQGHYRGYDPGSGTTDHSYSWHDAIQNTAAPLDDYGHGTHTVGTMVGDDGAGNQIGVAPGARWIGCRNMDHGNGSPATYLDCMEWTLAPYPPGGDPLTDGRPDLAPQIVNNSWGCPPSEGCDWSTLETAFARLRQAGIFEIAAAGNSGSGCSSVVDPPGIYDEVFSVGAVNSSRTLASFSSRGPVAIDGSNRRKPNVSAPGVSVRSCVPGGGYSGASGTSMASPHTSGVAALLWSATPALRGLVDLSRCILEQSASTPVTTAAQTCGGIPSTTYPNNQAGYGLVDAYAAITLPNADGDAAPDACDCRPADPGVFAAPSEATGLRFGTPGSSSLLWASQAASAGSATVYDVLRGDVQALLADHDIRDAACLDSNLQSPNRTDSGSPLAGKAFYYLVRAKNACGTGSYGAASSGAQRVSTICD